MNPVTDTAFSIQVLSFDGKEEFSSSFRRSIEIDKSIVLLLQQGLWSLMLSKIQVTDQVNVNYTK